MNNITTKIILSVLSITTSTTAIAQPWQELDSSAIVLNKTKNLDIEGLINSGKSVINADAGVIETHLSASEAATSPFTKTTQSKPVVMGIFDGANDMGTIQVMTMKRHPDGSATLSQRIFTPYSFSPVSAGGELSSNRFEVIKSEFGGNPFDAFKATGEYAQQFIKIDSNGFKTAMALAMKQAGAIDGYFAYLEPQVRTWKKTSGNAFRKKVTYYVQAHYKPHWQALVPIDSVSHGTVDVPFYTTNGKLVYGGVQALEVSNETSNFLSDRVEIYYAKKSKSGWTGLSMAIVAMGIGFATGGLGLLPNMTAMGGLTAGGALVGGMALYKGTLDEAVTSSGLNVTAVSSKKSLEYEGNWTMKWKNEMRDITRDGPLNAKGTAGAEFRKEKDDWQKLLSD